jgi:hypothetical protein
MLCRLRAKDAAAMHRDTRLSPHDERAVGVLAGVDPRVIRSYLAGRCRSTTAARIEAALRDFGRHELIRARDDLRRPT